MTTAPQWELKDLLTLAQEQGERYFALLPVTGDLSLIVLKGHLILEEMLFATLAAHCVDREKLKSAKLTFAQLLQMVQAVTRLPLGDQFWTPIGQLNSIRNSLVHNLEPNKIDAKIKSLYVECSKGSSHDDDEEIELSTMAVRSILFMMGTLSVIAPLSEFVELKRNSGDLNTWLA